MKPNWKPKKIKDSKFLEFIREQKCVFCGQTPCDPHHLPFTNKTRRSNDHNCIPLCRKCHTYLHAHPLAEQDLLDKLYVQAVKHYKAFKKVKASGGGTDTNSEF